MEKHKTKMDAPEKKILWSGRWSSIWVVKENGEYHACRDKWNDSGHHIDHLYHSTSLDEVIAYGEREESRA
ncbi:hypothetical protein CMO96_00330 [Candidatus Woesebacteria bacterium]|nr:hypothetical protein [Candidatus Woesebacteria bacterium]